MTSYQLYQAKDGILTVAELRDILKDWPDHDRGGEPSEVWITTGENLSSPVLSLSPLNSNSRNGGASILLDPPEFWKSDG